MHLIPWIFFSTNSTARFSNFQGDLFSISKTTGELLSDIEMVSGARTSGHVSMFFFHKHNNYMMLECTISMRK